VLSSLEQWNAALYDHTESWWWRDAGYNCGAIPVGAQGMLLTAILVSRKVAGAILLGILGTALVAVARGLGNWPTQLVSIPDPSGTFLQLDLAGALRLGLL